MTDLTQITCPPGLLDDETFERLREWPHGWEWWNGYEWLPTEDVSRGDCLAVRARPAPVWKEREGTIRLKINAGLGAITAITARHTGENLPAGTYTGPRGATITVEGEL